VARKNHASYKKAKVLKKYSKLVANEGMTSNRVNIGRKRTGDTDDGEDRDEGSENISSDKKARGKPAPFQRALEKAAEKRKEKAAAREAAATREMERQAKEKAREEKRRRHMQRSKKGQPIMKNQITGMLDKLMRAKGGPADSGAN